MELDAFSSEWRGNGMSSVLMRAVWISFHAQAQSCAGTICLRMVTALEVTDGLSYWAYAPRMKMAR